MYACKGSDGKFHACCITIEDVFVLFFIFLFGDKVSFCNPPGPRTHYVPRLIVSVVFVLAHRDPPSSVS